MDNKDFEKKLIAGLAMVCILVGTAVALVGLYSDIFIVSMIGLVLILIGMFIMEVVFKKYGSF